MLTMMSKMLSDGRVGHDGGVMEVGFDAEAYLTNNDNSSRTVRTNRGRSSTSGENDASSSQRIAEMTSVFKEIRRESTPF